MRLGRRNRELERRLAEMEHREVKEKDKEVTSDYNYSKVLPRYK